jgi:hypothetical protein
MSNNIETRIILGSLRYKSSPDVDYAVKVPLEQSSNNYIEYDRNNNVDLAQLFDNERQISTTFRPSTKITFITKNSYTGETSYDPFKNNMYLVNQLYYRDLQLNTNPPYKWGGFPSYNEFDLIRTDYDVTGYTQPPNNHIQFVSKSASTYNWNYFVSYAYSSNSNKKLEWHYSNSSFLQWTAKEGIPFQLTNTTSNGSNLITLKCPVKHGLIPGEFIYFNTLSYNGQNTFEVYSLGNGLYGTDEYYINIYDYGYTGTTFLNGTVGTLKRIINVNNSAETMSSYYVRRHKILTDVDDAILVKAGFELNVFDNKIQYQSSALTPNYVENTVTKNGNQSYTLSFGKDIDINGLIDNQKRPISELFFTIIHKGYFGWFYTSNSNFNYKVRQGYDFNLPEQSTSTPNNYWSNVTVNGSNDLTINGYISNGYTFNYVKSLDNGNTLDGDFCEWNDFNQTERVISNLNYKILFNENIFKTYPVNNINPLGYYYSPHTPITIKTYSDYIEEGENKQTYDVPDYAYYSKFRGSFRWRDIYTYGFIDIAGNGVDYPFMNGVHHPYRNTIFRLIPEGSNFTQIPYGIQDPIIDGCE